MNNKELFSNVINEISDYNCAGISECEKYGMTWGCDENCPVLNEGKCKIYNSVEEFLKELEGDNK